MIRRLAKHKLVADSLILMGVQVSGYLLPLVTLPYLTRVLGPENFGRLSVGTALVLYFAMVVEYGFSVTGPRQIAVVQNDPDKVSRIYSTLMACKLTLLLLSLLTLAGMVLWIPDFHTFGWLYVLSFLQVVGWGLSPNWLLQGLQRMRLVAISDYGAKIISVALIFILVRERGDYLWAAALQSGGFLLAAAIGLIMTFTLLSVRLVRPDWPTMRRAMGEGWPVFLSMTSMTIMTSTNTMILNSTASSVQVGYLAAAMRLIIAARALTNPFTTAIYPHMSKLAAENPVEGLKFLRKQLLWTSLPFLGISLVLLGFSPLIVDILYKAEYREAGVLLRIMAFTPFMHAVSMCFGTYYMLAYGFEKEWSKIITRMVVANFVVLGILLQLMQPARAVALTTTLMDLFSVTYGFLFYRRTSGEVALRRVNSAPSPK